MFTVPVMVFTRDLFMRAIKNYLGPTVTLREAKCQIVQQVDFAEVEDKLSLSQLHATRERLKSAELVPLLAMVDPKGKGLETPLSN